MLALPGLLLLVIVDYLRPQEYFEPLARFPLLHFATALAAFGFVLDLRLGLSRLRRAPHLVLAVLLFLWSLGTVFLGARDQLVSRAEGFLVPLLVYALVAHGLQSFRSLQVLAGVLLAIALGLAVIGVEQGLAPWGCHKIGTRYGSKAYFFDGRSCQDRSRQICEGEGAEPGVDYVCERVGLLGTQTDAGRVRYRGTLQDPNELSLAIGITLPFAFAFLERRRTASRFLLVAASVGLIGLCTYFTQSRGGQLVFLTVLLVYFVQRVGAVRGFVVGGVLALPVLLLGGRSGAESSTMERLECWWVGMRLFTSHLIFGVGQGQFTDHHYLTAHSSFVLTAAELGAPGLVLWSAIIYLSVKTTVRALRAGLPPVAHAWSLALFASTVGLIVGSMFLSYSYKTVMWLFLGMTGVLYQAVRRHQPEFSIRFGARDLGAVVVIDAVVAGALILYTGAKMGW